MHIILHTYIHTYIRTFIIFTGSFEEGAALARLPEAQNLNSIKSRHVYIHTYIHTYIDMLSYHPYDQDR